MTCEEIELARFLLMLRPGPVDGIAICERTGSDRVPRAATQAVREGLVERSDTGMSLLYRLTDKGRAKCPTRCEFQRMLEESSHA